MKNSVFGWDLISSLAFQPPQRTNKTQYNSTNAAKLRIEYVPVDVTQIHQHHFTSAPASPSSSGGSAVPATPTASGSSSLESTAAQMIRNYLTRDRQQQQQHSNTASASTAAIPMGTIGTPGGALGGDNNLQYNPSGNHYNGAADGVVRISFVRFLPKGTLPGTPLGSPIFRGTPQGRGNGIAVNTPATATPTGTRTEGDRRSPVPAAVFTVRTPASQINSPPISTPGDNNINGSVNATTTTRSSNDGTFIGRRPLSNDSLTATNEALGASSSNDGFVVSPLNPSAGLQPYQPVSTPLNAAARQHLQNEVIDKWTGGVILYAHGAGEDIPSSYAYFESLATETQCLVVAFDYLGYGYSTGLKDDCTEANAYLAIETIFNHLTTKLRIEPRRIVLMGRSLGSGPVVELAHREAVRTAGLAGIILISPMYSAASVVKYGSYVPSFLDIFNNHNKITSINTCPILIIHGDRDEVIPYWHAEKLYDIAYNARRTEQNQRLGIPTGIIARSIQRFLPALSATPQTTGGHGGPSPKSSRAGSGGDELEEEEAGEDDDRYLSCEDSPTSKPNSGRNSAPTSARSRGASRGPNQSPSEGNKPKNSEKNRVLLSASGAKPIPMDDKRKMTSSTVAKQTTSNPASPQFGASSATSANVEGSTAVPAPQTHSQTSRETHLDPLGTVDDNGINTKKKERFGFVKDLIKAYKGITKDDVKIEQKMKNNYNNNDSDDDTHFYEAAPVEEQQKTSSSTVKNSKASKTNSTASQPAIFSSGGSLSAPSPRVTDTPRDQKSGTDSADQAKSRTSFSSSHSGSTTSNRPNNLISGNGVTANNRNNSTSAYCGGGFGSVAPPPKFSPPSAVILLTVEGCGHHDLEFRRGRHLYAQINNFLSQFCGQQNGGGGIGRTRTLMALSAGLSAASALQMQGTTPNSGNNTPGAYYNQCVSRRSNELLTSPSDPLSHLSVVTSLRSFDNGMESTMSGNSPFPTSAAILIRDDSGSALTNPSSDPASAFNSTGHTFDIESNERNDGKRPSFACHSTTAFDDSAPTSPEVMRSGTPLGSFGCQVQPQSKLPPSLTTINATNHPSTFHRTTSDNSSRNSMTSTPKSVGLNSLGAIAFPAGYIPYKGGAAAVGNGNPPKGSPFLPLGSTPPVAHFNQHLGDGVSSGTNTPLNRSIGFGATTSPMSNNRYGTTSPFCATTTNTPTSAATGRYTGPLTSKQ